MGLRAQMNAWAAAEEGADGPQQTSHSLLAQLEASDPNPTTTPTPFLTLRSSLRTQPACPAGGLTLRRTP